MPLQGIEAIDHIASLVQFRTSLITELALGPNALLHSRRHKSDLKAAQAALPAAFWDDLHTIYEPFHNGMAFIELTVDAPDHLDVPGFIRHIRTMPPQDFMFYVAGRVIPRAVLGQIPLTHKGIETAMAEYYHEWYCDHFWRNAPFDQILQDIPGFQARLADLFTVFWERYLSRQSSALADHWEQAIRAKEGLLERQGGQALLEYVTGKTNLPDPLPAGQPYQEVSFIPAYYISRAAYMFFGYGNVTVLFDSQRSESRAAETERVKESALNAFKALGDANRLKILRLIAHGEKEFNGKTIAAKLNLSASAVSRHLAQLRDGGLIVEESEDNRNITYRLQKDFITALPEMLLDYLID